MRTYLVFFFIFCYSFLVLFSSGFIDSQDGLQYLAVSRRMYYDHTFELPPERYPEDNIHLSINELSNGKMYSPTGLGYSVALLPAVMIEDVFLRAAGIDQLSAFPLQSDWPVLLFASFTNAFFGAVLAVVLFVYLRSFGVNIRQSTVLAFLGIIATNLFPYTKHAFPHMMFASFLLLSFYAIRKAALAFDRKWVLIAGLAYGVVVLSYNPTFVLPALPLVVYYFALNPINFSIQYWKKVLLDVLVGLFGLLPFVLVYFWFNWVRFGGVASTGYGDGGIPWISIPSAYVFFEGFWGVFFSPGKSIFLFTPPLICVLLFWFKFRKSELPELLSFGLLSTIYLYFTATLLGGPDYLLWHGESSWGPRYLTPILPFAWILISILVLRLGKWERIVGWCLILAGILIQIPGVLLPYQIKFAGIQTDAFFNGRNFNVYEYGNIIPRYSPVLTMTKTLVKRIHRAPQVFGHGPSNVRLLDGFDYPFDLGWAAWRHSMPSAKIGLSNTVENPVREIFLQVGNHQVDPTSSYSAQLTARFNTASAVTVTIPVAESKTLTITPPAEALQENSEITLSTEMIGTDSATLKGKQIVFLQAIAVNGIHHSLRTIDYPYVSPISKELFDAEYYYWGGQNSDPWSIWHMHSGVYEQTFDIWWIRPFHYWDLPRPLFATLFGLFGSTASTSFLYLYFAVKHEKS